VYFISIEVLFISTWFFKSGRVKKMDNRHEEISQAAYFLYEKSGWVAGRDEANWLAAEQELLAGSKPVKRRRTVKKSPAAAPRKSRVRK